MTFIGEISFVLAMAMNFLLVHANSRQRMMIFKTVASSFAAFYFWTIGADTALIAASIIGLGCFMQGIIPERHLRKTLLLRTSIAVVMCVTAIALAAGNAVEALPLMATICGRMSEMQSCRQRIRMGYIFGSICWLQYATQEGLLIVFACEAIGLSSLLFAIWRHEQGRKKAVLIPVKAV